MKKKLLYTILIIITFIIIVIFYSKFNNLDNKAIRLAEKYVEDNNIMVNNSLFVDLKILNDSKFDKCHNGSGILIINENNQLSYHSYLKCDNYATTINKNSNIELNGSDIIILEKDEEFIDPGYSSEKNVLVFKKDYDNVQIISYYVADDEKLTDYNNRVIIYTTNKDQNIDGTFHYDYPIITLNGNTEISINYNSEYQDALYSATDYYDGDITNKVKINGSVDTKKIGEYDIKYYVINSKGNYSIAKRKVKVISNIVNYTYDVGLSTLERVSNLNIILTIKGEGYNYTELPDGKTSNDKIINYYVQKNDTYKFKIYDINDSEKEVLVKVDNLYDHEKINTVFKENYPPASTSMIKVEDNLIVDYFKSKGYASNSTNYRIVIDGEELYYDVKSNKLSYAGDYVFCEFYMTLSSKLGFLDNTITLLGGSGERKYGPIANSRIPSNANLNDYSLLIVPKKDDDYNMSKHPKMVSACTKMGMFLAGIKKGNSIIGFSEGAQAASKTVSYNKVIYDQLVLVNGSAYYTSDKTNLISNYQPFQNMEIIMLESKNNNNWNETIIRTIYDLLKNGVNSNMIQLYTNDNTLINTFTNVINLNVVNYDWSGHGSGYRMINESNILSYLSSK